MNFEDLALANARKELKFSGCMYCKKGSFLTFINLNYNELKKHILRKHKIKLKEFDNEINKYLKFKHPSNSKLKCAKDNL